jgi:8-oxo-dGTP diphosphatase
MAYDDFYRLSVHAVILDKQGRVLQVKATYANKNWGLPGGTLDPGETIHEALVRECQEELGVNVCVKYMSGMYFHSQYNSHACIFKCEMPENSEIKLSEEHSEYRFFPIEELSPVQKQRVLDCLEFDGQVKSARF